ncbi:MAG: hypothetical protein ABI665_21225 [Vicinamibacterales bacterium]
MTIHDPPVEERHRLGLPSLQRGRSLKASSPKRLGVLEEDQFLIISLKSGWAYVQCAAQCSFGLRAEAMSNNYLHGSHAISDAKVSALQALGWLAPTGTPDEATPKLQPDGSPNFFRDFPRPVPFEGVARMAVRALIDVFDIPHPGFLDDQAFDRSKRAILIPTLGLMRRLPAPPPAKPPVDTVERVRGLMLDAIRKAAGDSTLEFQDDGHLALRFGSALVIVRVHKEPFCVRIVSPVLAKVEADDLLIDRLNELNARVRFARLFVEDGTVFAVTEVSASPFVAEHVFDACGSLGRLADEIDDILQKQFGGRTGFGQFRSTSRVH